MTHSPKRMRNTIFGKHLKKSISIPIFEIAPAVETTTFHTIA